MYLVAITSALMCASIGCYAHRQHQLSVSSYNRELTIHNAEIILSKHLTTRRGNLVYAVCQQTNEYFFERMQCNVSIEVPSFVDSPIDNNTCLLHLVSDESPTDRLTELNVDVLNERKVLIWWSVKNAQNNWHTKLRILSIVNCQFVDLSFPIRKIAHVITRKSQFDLIVNYQNFCKSLRYCKVSYDANGKKISGPIEILYDSDVPVVIPSLQPFLHDGYLLAGMTPRGYIVDIEPDGRLKPLMTIDIPREQTLRVSVSSLYGFYSLCSAFVNGTTITCHLYDPRTSFRMNATLQLEDRSSNDTRWIAIRNFHGKSLILITGQVSNNSRNVDNCSLVKLHSDGRWSKAIRISGINFKGIDEFHARHSINKRNELCFHFVAKQRKSYQHGIINRLKSVIKCLSKSYVNADNLVVIN